MGLFRSEIECSAHMVKKPRIPILNLPRNFGRIMAVVKWSDHGHNSAIVQNFQYDGVVRLGKFE
jgi:hypothetical protein